MFSPIPEILDEIRRGRMVVLTDDEQRENEGDLVLAAQFVTPEAINFMLSAARGYLCLSLTGADCDRLDLHAQTAANTSVRGTPLMVSIDGHPRHGFTTGVSARERALTIRHAIDPTSRRDDFVRPGHINPLRARDGGVLVRTGQTEGSIDLCRLAGLYPAAVIIEIMRDDGEMARVPDLERFCHQHRIKMCSVNQVIQWRLERESLIRRVEPASGMPIRTHAGDFTLFAFHSIVDALPHLALTAGGIGRLDHTGAPVETDEPTLVRVHRRDILGDIFGDLDSSPEGPTGDTLRASMKVIQAEGRGVIMYLRPEWSDDERPLAQRLQMIQREGGEPGPDSPDLTHPGSHLASVPARSRELGTGCQILRNLGVRRLRLLTNHQTELPALEAFGLEVVERVPIPLHSS
jgi:3,4-dihydroxy 2-butanone 4-phosphate synthase / GTP cyclohydrolase II